MQNNYAKIQVIEAELIAISSDKEAGTKQTVNNEGLKYTVLSDSNKASIAAYNVIDQGNTRIARPASYIINKNGTIVWKSLNTKAERVPTANILAELGKL